MNIPTAAIVIAVVMIGFVLTLSAPAKGKAGELTNIEKLFLESEQTALIITPEPNPSTTGGASKGSNSRSSYGNHRKEAREANPSERTEEFFAQLVAYSIVGFSITIVAWLLNKWKKKKAKTKISRTRMIK